MLILIVTYEIHNSSGSAVKLIMNGAERARTANPCLAKAVLSQLSYGPEFFRRVSISSPGDGLNDADAQTCGTSTQRRSLAERMAESMTAWTAAPSRKEGVQGRFSAMAAMNSTSWS